MAQRLRSTSQSQSLAAEPTSLEPIWSVFSLFCSLLVIALYILVCFRVGGAVAIFLLLLTPGTLLVATQLPRALAPRPLTIPTLRSFLANPELERVERLYGEILLMLLETSAPKSPPLRELLQEVNRLVEVDRVLAAQQTRLQSVTQGQALQAAQREYYQLIERLAVERDPITHEVLQESLSLCTEKVEHLRSLPLLLHQLETQREFLGQGVALAHAALLRTRTTHLTLAPPDLTTLRSSVRQLTSESQALEEATRSLREL